MRIRRDRGVALILVMTVILALSLIATPFVLSMLLQEKAAVVQRYGSQAAYGADGAVKYATWRLMKGLDPVERRYPSTNPPSYYYDLAAEMEVRLDEAFLKEAKVLDPRGAIWGVTVQDENGKVNCRTAPADVINRVRTNLGPLLNPRDGLTLYSGRDAVWVFPQRIRALNGGLKVDSLGHYGPRARLRAVKPGQKPIEVKVDAVVDGLVITQPDIPGGYLDGVVHVERRHPVNPNTARREVLTAIFEGVRLVNQAPVDRASAGKLAEALSRARTTRLEDFIAAVAASGMSKEQMAAVAINAVSPTAAALDGSGTVPLCFASHDVYTVEAFSSMNTPAGSQAAGRALREIVSVSPPAQLQLMVESQFDFDPLPYPPGVKDPAFEWLDTNLVAEYPIGTRWISFPNLLPAARSDTALKPQQTPENEAYVMPAVARDYRGKANEDKYRAHYDDTQEGKKLENGAESFAWDQVLAVINNQPDIAAGGMEMWVRLKDTAPPLTLFDVREGLAGQVNTNRLTLSVESAAQGRDLVLAACDSTIGDSYVGVEPPAGVVRELYKIDNGIAESRVPVPVTFPEKDDWYHLTSMWKGTRWAQIGVLVDAFSRHHPQKGQAFRHVTTEGTVVSTTLTGIVGPTSTSIPLKDSGWIPSSLPTPVMIGDEVILMIGGAGIRAARGTTARDHPRGSAVTLFGYSSAFTGGSATWGSGANAITINYPQLTTGGATVSSNFGAAPTATVVGDKTDPLLPLVMGIDATQTEISVTTPNILDFPAPGYIKVEDEVIYYTDRSLGGIIAPSTAKFSGCVRGQQGTAAAFHITGRRAEMWAVPVSATANYLTPTLIQVGDEWIGPVQVDTGRPFWIPYPALQGGGNPRQLPRGALGTPRGDHVTTDKIIPTFLAREVDPDLGRKNLGRYDMVTLIDGQNGREQQVVRRGSGESLQPGSPVYTGQPTSTAPWGAQIAAFYENVSRPWVPDGQGITRILKWPSGELPGAVALQNVKAQLTIGPLNGHIDEVKFFGERKGNLKTNRPLAQGDTRLEIYARGGNAIADGDRMPSPGGVIKMGDELIGYGAYKREDISPPNGPTTILYTLTRLKRGWLFSTAQDHPQGERVLALPWLPVTTLAGDVADADTMVMLERALCGTKKYTEGYILVNDEIIGFMEAASNGLQLRMPPKFDGSTGLFRGMFGTRAAKHVAANSLVFGIPWRYWDNHKRQEFDNRMPFFQWSAQLSLANWKTVTWTEEVPKQDPNVVVHAIARLDGRGEFWDLPGVTDESLIYENKLGQTSIPIRRIGHEGDAGQFDLRFTVEYRPNAFDALEPWNSNSWKRAPKLKVIRVDYDRPTQTLHHEER